MTERRVPIWLYISIAITAALAGFSMWQRYQAEGKNHAVGLVTEIETVQLLASSQGITLEEGLKKLKEKGLTGVVLSEETIGDLVAENRLAVTPSQVTPTGFDLDLRNRVGRALTNRFGTVVAPVEPPKSGESAPDAFIGIGDLDPLLARSASIGLNPVMANQARTLNLDIIARLGNPIGATEKYVRESVKWAAENGATIFLPQGEQVLGRRDSMDALTDELEKQKMFYATPEFAKIGGDDAVVGKIPERIIRLHSAQTQELDKLSPAEAIERYGKAAAERNQRLLLLRPFTSASAQPVDSFGDFVGKVRSQIEREGYKAATPHPFEDSGVPMPIFVLISISTLPVFFWLATVFMGGKAGGLVLAGWAALGLVALLAFATALPAARGPFALLCTLAYPTMAFVLLDLSPVGIVPGYVRTSLISLVGGFCVAGLLNGLPFFVKADAFAGVKLAHFLPIGIIGLYFLSRKTNVKETLRTPMFWQQAILAIVILGGFAFMSSRTGNDNPAGVSGIELKFRALMDQFMYVRPRTKEFLIGNPAMIVALGMLASKRSYGAWVALAMMIGAIGQTSMVNTMCHLHTPLTVSLARIGVGWVLGGILGAIVWGGLSRIPARGQQ